MAVRAAMCPAGERRHSVATLFVAEHLPPAAAVTVQQQMEERDRSQQKQPWKAKSDSSSSSSRRLDVLLRYGSLALMVVQFVCQVLITRHASTRSSHPPFTKTVAVVLKEALEAFASFCLFLALNRPRRRLWAALGSALCPSNCVPMLLPALAYTMKNFLLFVAIDHLDAATFTISYQLKILATAFFLVLMLDRRLSSIQWISLCLLVGGVAVVELSALKWAWVSTEEAAVELMRAEQSAAAEDSLLLLQTVANPNSSSFPSHLPSAPMGPLAQMRLVSSSSSSIAAVRPSENFLAGLASVLAACVLSGYAGVFLEKVVKQSGDSLWLRNFQLCFLSTLIGSAISLLMDVRQMAVHGPLLGFDWLIWAVVAVQMLGGLLVAMVIRYADNILKAFANSVSILGISLLSALLFGTSLGWLFFAGTALTIGAMALYSLFPPAAADSGAGSSSRTTTTTLLSAAGEEGNC